MNTSRPSSLKTFIVVGGIVVLAVFVVVVLSEIERAQARAFKPGELVRIVREGTIGTRTEADSALLVAMGKNDNSEGMKEMYESGRDFLIYGCHKGIRIIESNGNFTLVKFEKFHDCGQGWNDVIHDGSAPTEDVIRLYAIAQFHVTSFGKGTSVIVLHGGPEFDHSNLPPELDPLSDAFHLIDYDQRGRRCSVHRAT